MATAPITLHICTSAGFLVAAQSHCETDACCQVRLQVALYEYRILNLLGMLWAEVPLA